MSKKTLVLGASPKPERFSNKAIRALVEYGHEVVAIGLRESEVGDIKIVQGFPPLSEIHTVTLYMNASNQKDYIEYIINLKPKRIIFNPGTWNEDLADLADEAGIEVDADCTLVMLATDSY
ncbi:MAG TPA: CoA-binding protein [Bacteroidales bacterium]|nr:CoA-binding protein [Bacteroidales bacterium]